MSLSPAAFLTPASKHTTKLQYQEILEYFLWSAMVHMGRYNWDSALQCLESVITYPCRDGVSKIMTEAYKKWVLVGILAEGRLLPLPKSTSATPAKAYRIIGKPYETLAQISESGTASRLKSEVEFGQNLWRADGNVGLVTYVLNSYQRFQIRGLSQVYSKISIPEVVSQTTSAETGHKLPTAQAGETLVRQMISLGHLQATLSNPPSGPSILTFSPSDTALTEAQFQKQLAESAARIQALTQEIKQTDRMLTYDKEYIKYIQKSKKSKAGIDGSSQEWHDANDDEDLMGSHY